MKKILIILAGKQFYKIDKFKYEIDEFKKKNIHVEMHAIVDFLFPNISNTYNNNLRDKSIKKFTTFFSWKKQMQNILSKYKKKNIIVINETAPASNFIGLFINIYLKKYLNLVCIERISRDQPILIKNYNLRNNFYFIKNIINNPKKIFIFLKKYFILFLEKFFYLDPSYFLVHGLSQDKKFKKKNNCKIIKGNGYDYNMSLSTNDLLPSENVYNSDYAIFLETPYPLFSGDRELLGNKKSILTAANWVKSLNNFFLFIENELNLKVFISPHPRIKHKSRFPSYYNGRRILNDITPINTRNAKLIITRLSTSSSYAVINNVPIMFIYTNELINSINDLSKQFFLAKEFGKIPVNIDNFDKKTVLKNVFKINKKKYKNFKENYLTLVKNDVKNSSLIMKLFNNV